MKRQCTETASAVAAAIADQTEFYFLNCRYTACFFIGRMIRSHVRECIYIIHFAGCQRFCRWILHHITFVCSELKAVIGLGVDYITTDYPERLQALLKK